MRILSKRYVVENGYVYPICKIIPYEWISDFAYSNLIEDNLSEFRFPDTVEFLLEKKNW